MRKSTVTQEAVNSACEGLRETGQNITVSAVIATTGGSFTTVSPMVKTWKAECQPVTEVALPNAVMDAMGRAVKDVWSTASKLAGEEVERIKVATDESLAESAAEVAEYSEEVARLEADLATTQSALAKAEGQLQVANDKSLALAVSEASLQAQVKDRDETIKQQRADYGELKKELLALVKSGRQEQ